MDYREAEEQSWFPSWSNSLWQGWSCRLVHCLGENATDPIWRVLASSDGISSWTPLKPQHSNPNPLANQLRCIDFLTPPTPLIIPHRLFVKLLMGSHDWLFRFSERTNCQFLLSQTWPIRKIKKKMNELFLSLTAYQPS